MDARDGVDWQKAKGGKRRRRNREEAADNNEDSDKSTISIGEPEFSANKVQKIPPIVVNQKILDMTKFLQQMHKECEQEVSFKLTPRGINIYTTSKEDFKRVQPALVSYGVPNHSHTCKEDRLKHLVLKNLPFPAQITDIKNEAAAHDIILKKINVMKKKARLKMQTTTVENEIPIYLVTVDSAENVTKLLKIKTIASFRIKWEPYTNSRKITQCYRCQEFGQGISNCNNPPKCVKCSQSHLTSECKKDKTTPPICANCEGPHPANYRLCPKYINHTEKVESQK